MAKVDFYLIQQPEDQDRLFFTCRLVEKVLGQGLKVYIHTRSQAEAQEIDDLLWSFKPESFIPHAIVGLEGMEDELEDEEIPVLIGYDNNRTESGQLLVNLTADIPPFCDSFERIAEIVANREEAKAASREHWNSYKEKGFELDHHQL